MNNLETQISVLPANNQNKFSYPPNTKPVPARDGLSYLAKQVAKDPVQTGWATWLDQREWQLFSTLTTARELTLPGARRSINKLAQYLKENQYPAEIFWTAEPFDVKEGYHLHSLLRFTDLSVTDNNKMAYNTLISGWRQITADKSARIYSQRYEPKKGAHSYIGKYITKDRSDYDLIAPFLDNTDQLADPGIFQGSLQDQAEMRKKEREAYNKKQFIFKQLLDKGINAADNGQDKAVYINTDITFDVWEHQQYKQELTARMQFPNKIGKPTFTLTKMISS